MVQFGAISLVEYLVGQEWLLWFLIVATVLDSDSIMRVLVTGSAGFIRSTVSHRLLIMVTILWVDDYNDYYEVSLKKARGQRC